MDIFTKNREKKNHTLNSVPSLPWKSQLVCTLVNVVKYTALNLDVESFPVSYTKLYYMT